MRIRSGSRRLPSVRAFGPVIHTPIGFWGTISKKAQKSVQSELWVGVLLNWSPATASTATGHLTVTCQQDGRPGRRIDRSNNNNKHRQKKEEVPSTCRVRVTSACVAQCAAPDDVWPLPRRQKKRHLLLLNLRGALIAITPLPILQV